MFEIDISTPANPGCTLLMDECDAHLLDGVKWTPDRKRSGAVYAHRRPRGPLGQARLYLHRVIMNAKAGEEIDHIDRNGLNNTRANLRLVTRLQNEWNKAGRGASRFKGVHRKRDKWTAEIKHDGKVRRLGVFAAELDAALAYDAACLDAGRDGTGLNFPELADNA